MSINFTHLSEIHLAKVLEWRTQPDVTKYMFTDIEYNLDNQLKWFNSIKDSKLTLYWIVSVEGKPIGLVNLNVDELNRTCNWGFYVGESDYNILGGIIPAYVYNYIFGFLKLNKVSIEVMEGNEKVRKLHKLYGCREVGVYRQHIYKYDKFHDVYSYELLKEDWDKISKRYQKYKITFV